MNQPYLYLLLTISIILNLFIIIQNNLNMKKIKLVLIGETQDVVAALAALQTQVTSEQTVEGSAITLLQGLSAQLAALANNTTDPATVAAINSIASTISTNAATLAAAVAANTPAASSTTATTAATPIVAGK